MNALDSQEVMEPLREACQGMFMGNASACRRGSAGAPAGVNIRYKRENISMVSRFPSLRRGVQGGCNRPQPGREVGGRKRPLRDDLGGGGGCFWESDENRRSGTI